MSLRPFWLALVSGDRGLVSPMVGDGTSIKLLSMFTVWAQSHPTVMGSTRDGYVDGHLKEVAVLRTLGPDLVVDLVDDRLPAHNEVTAPDPNTILELR